MVCEIMPNTGVVQKWLYAKILEFLSISDAGVHKNERGTDGSTG